ncbi:uncharacterized protein LOC120697361 isoform X5 [Panicum virgatum]|uniref:Agenet domain-containing protein n=1 Tax=Panicum virgatum TaxID=38727 RepID=A0A8T0UQ37_PANVG|nr:uncharacterized protein LOC120697361 isoform X5 [Panicum virgatum]KAG2624427.1 hypothetical protein PVAP13_3KG129400 [Panicum virgatum]
MKPPQWTELQRFNPGDLVEVVPDEPGEQGAHYAAVVVERSTQPRGYTVEYDDLVEREGSDRPLREVVPAQILRPHPPPRCTYSGEAPGEHAAVDAFLDVAWWLAVYLGVVDGGGKVRVCFPDTREVMNFDAADVRPHFEWGWGGSFRKRSALGMEMTVAVPYTKGMTIEVSMLVDNSVVAWLPAFVVKTFWKSNLLVDYTVSNSDGTALPGEIVDVKHVRPCLPQASAISFCINDKVEAFQGGGWWLGVITDVHPELKYTFKSAHLGVEVQLSQKLLRPRYDWVYGPRKQESENVSSNDEKFGGAWFEVARSKGTASPSKKQQPNNPSWKSTTPKSSPPPRAAPIKKRKRRADGHGRPDLAPSLVKKHRSPKLRPSEENKLCKSSSKGIYPDLHEKHLLRDAPRPDEQAKPAPQPEPTPAPAQRRKTILNLSVPMIQPAAVPDATVSLHTRASDVQNNEAVQNTVPEVGTCTKSPAKSLPTPLDNIIKELKDCREQWLQAQSQLDHSATKAKEMEGQVAKLRAAHEADAQHLREVMNKQASLEQRLKLKDKEIEDLKEKLVDLDEQKSCVEAELPRGAVMAASHALGVLKNHVPDLDIGILSKGYACTPAEAQALADQVRPIVEPFIERLGLSVSVVDAFVGRTYMCRAKEG